MENCTQITNNKNIKKVYSNTKEDLLPILGDYSSRSPILSSHTDLPNWLVRMMNFGTEVRTFVAYEIFVFFLVA